MMASTSKPTSSSPYPSSSSNIDQTTAKRLLKEGATLVVEGMPIGCEFGIDMNVYKVGEKFHGVKMIPVGLHLIYYSAVSKEQQVAPRSGFCHFFKRGEVMCKMWDEAEEDLVEIDDDQTHAGRSKIESEVLGGALDGYLGAYQYDNYTCWVGLTDHITHSLLSRIMPKCGKLRAATEFIPRPFNSSATNKYDESSIDSDGLPNLKVNPDSAINFNQIPKPALYPEGSTPAEISRHSMDLTFSLEHMMKQYEDHHEILGELQFAFVAFLVGQNYDAFEYWKLLMKTLCSCDEALSKYPKMYLNFIRVLHFQLQEVPPDLFVDIVENNNMLVGNLRRFFSNIDQSSSGVDEELKNRAKKFKRNLTKKYKWDFSSEQDDETPVVVKL